MKKLRKLYLKLLKAELRHKTKKAAKLQKKLIQLELKVSDEIDKVLEDR
jgi:hypothetical protein